jgi:virginiamycin B lyase
MRAAAAGVIALGAALAFGAAAAADAPTSRSIAELVPIAVIPLGTTADWVAITEDAVWVGTTGPNAVQQIDPRTNARVATVPLPGNPCAGLAVGFGSLWVPLCAEPNALARVDLRTRAVTVLPGLGPAAKEGGVTTSPDSVWLVVDDRASLARIDPASGRVRQTIPVPRGSYNPLYSDGQVWVTRADGAEVTVVDAGSGAVLATARSGPNPRFLTAGAGAVWTLNQGDGSLTRIDARTRAATKTIALRTPGHGGDIAFGAGMVWTTMDQVPLSVVDAATGAVLCQWTGPGGDSLGIGHGGIWLTDYHAGTVSRLGLDDSLARCRSTPRH